MKKISILLIVLAFLVNIHSVWAISDVFCDWADDTGNPLCYFSGHWADHSSRDHPVSGRLEGAASKSQMRRSPSTHSFKRI